MRSPARSGAVIATVAAIIALSACASAPDAEPTVSPAPPPAASTPPSTPSPGHEEPDPQDPSTWMISDAGIGPIELGSPFTDEAALLPEGATNDPENCAWTAWWDSPDDVYQLIVARASDAAPEGPVTVVEASAAPGVTAIAGPRTAQGIGIGSTVAEVEAAYPDAEEVESSIGSGDGIPVYLKVSEHVFFTVYEQPVVAGVTVTTADQPPYELCG